MTSSDMMLEMKKRMKKPPSYRMRIMLWSGGVDPEAPAPSSAKWKSANDESECEKNCLCETDHDLPKQTTISPQQFSLFLANDFYFLVAFCAALVTLPAPPLSVLTTDLMTLYMY